MNASEERENEALRRVLEKRFEHLERPVRDQVSQAIWRRLGRESHRTGGLIAALVLLLLGIVFYLGTNKPGKMQNATGKPASIHQNNRRIEHPTASTLKPARENSLLTVPEIRETLTNTKPNNAHSKKNRPIPYRPSRLERATSFPNAQDAKEPAGNEYTNSADAETPHLITPVAFRDMEPTMVQPEISVKSDSAQKSTPSKESKRATWLISATPLQTFQSLRLNSTPEVVYQNIRFPGIGSSESKGLKFAAGLERSGWQLVGSYAYLSYYTRYEIGTDEFELSPTPADPYRLVRKGESREMHDEFHVLAVALRRSFGDHKPLPLQIRGFAGIEYARTLHGGMNNLHVQAGLLKSWLAFSAYEVSAGPFAEAGLLNRTAMAGAWRYRPYQIGVTVQLRKMSSR